MLVIINADDLGANEAVNHAIFEMMLRKCVTSATVLSNGPCFDQASKALKCFPDCSFGIHLNISEFKPITVDERLGIILDENGLFKNNLERVRITPSLLVAVTREFSAQIEKALSLGVKISHIDSHYHVHTLPQMFAVVKYLQQKYRLRKVRTTYNIYRLGERISRSLLLKKELYHLALNHVYSTRTTGGFTDLLAFCENATLNKIRHQSVEIMVHPGSAMNKEEDALLSSGWWERLPVNIKLINYNEL